MEESRQKKMQLPDKNTRNINSKTIPAFCDLLKATSWQAVIKEQNPKNAFDNFFDIINDLRDISFPEIVVKQKQKKLKYSPWMSKLFAKKVRKPTHENIAIFKTYNKMYNKVRRVAKQM